jgi:hypothetical protein
MKIRETSAFGCDMLTTGHKLRCYPVLSTRRERIVFLSSSRVIFRLKRRVEAYLKLILLLSYRHPILSSTQCDFPKSKI